ncbi:MAG TPA: DUF1990 family protein [Miltoncostaeaceae bacterium]|nr:DUF1990 family protein [Miltoncostaeaceae bacterium]
MTVGSGARGEERVLDLAGRAWGALRWPVGMAVATYRVARRIDVVRRTETRPGEEPHPVEGDVPGDPGPLQPRSAGAGPSARRRYRLRVRDARMSPEQLMSALAADPNLASPFEVARFVKRRGLIGGMREGDEYVVWMPGPWNGPVRVAERTPTSFRLATLAGHMEAGQIAFSAARDGDELVIDITSSARSGSTPFRILYGPLRVGQEFQLHMWVHFLQRAGALAGGTPAGPAEVTTIRYPDDRGGLSRRASPRAMRALRALPSREPNFSSEALSAHDPAEGWRVDDHRIDLPREPPGPPQDGGPWAIAVEVLREYGFADPSLIRAVYDPASPLDGRDMLLEGRFMGLSFMLGVRVVATVDETTALDGRPARVWGWSYATLQGHLEMGRLDYAVVKRCDTGEVQFRLHAVSRPAAIPNPVVRAGFRIFGRRLQKRFARTAGERMARIVRERLAARDA